MIFKTMSESRSRLLCRPGMISGPYVNPLWSQRREWNVLRNESRSSEKETQVRVWEAWSSQLKTNAIVLLFRRLVSSEWMDEWETSAPSSSTTGVGIDSYWLAFQSNWFLLRFESIDINQVIHCNAISYPSEHESLKGNEWWEGKEGKGNREWVRVACDQRIGLL